MITELTWQDIPALASLGPTFAAESPAMGVFNRVHFTTTLSELMNNGLVHGWVATSDEGIVGALAFVLSPSLTSGEMTAQELFWFVLPDHRGLLGVKLLKRAISELRPKVTKIFIGAIQNDGAEAVCHLLTRAGGTLLERMYVF